MDIKSLAQELATAFVGDKTLTAPSEGFTNDTALAVSYELFEILKTTLPRKMVGRKIGKNPAVGFFATPIYDHEGELPKNLLGLEPELAVVWGDDIAKGIGDEKEFYQALKNAGAELILGIEIIGYRYPVSPLPWDDSNRPPFPLLLADHFHQWGFVVGQERKPIEPDRDYGGEAFNFIIDGKPHEAEKSKLPFGNPLNILWQFYQNQNPSHPILDINDFKKGEVITLGSLFAMPLPTSASEKHSAEFHFPSFMPLKAEW